ncbi:MAG: helix-turn-helix domain-containing protein [Pseudonocardiaceae bacterium]
MAELADLLTGAPARHALALRDITAVFRILRDAGVSQLHIARATGQRQPEVSEIISGRQVQSAALLERIADGLGVPRGWMGLAYNPDLGPEPAVSDDATSADERNGNLLRHAATLLCGKPVFGAADPIRVEHAPTPVPRLIGSADIEQVEITTKQLDQLTGDLGGIPMADALTAHARASEALLGAAMSEPVRQRLLVALADTHRAAGYAAADAGLRDLARQHHIRSMDCAGAAGDLLRAVVSLDSLGWMELDVEPNEALKLFQLGAATAPSPLPRALVEYHGALALGLLGLAGEALAALRRARDTYQAASDEPRPWKYFAIALPHVEGRTHLALGRFDSAAATLAATGEGVSHMVTCKMHHFGYLATAQLRCGELRSGLHTAKQAISLAKDLRSASTRDGLAPLQEAAAARRDTSCRDLARELATLRSAA